MSLKDRILQENITSLGQLPPAERELVQADPGLTAMIKENAALGKLTEEIPAQPPWENLRTDVIQEYTQPKENAMTLVSRLMNGRSWYARAAIAALIVTGLFALSLLLPRAGSINPVAPAWAATDGYILSYYLPAPAGNCQDDPLLKAVSETVKGWKSASSEELAGAEGEEYKIMLRIEIEKQSPEDTGTLKLSVMAVNLSYEQMEALGAELTEKAGLPEPLIEESTWFHDKELQNPDCVSVTFNNRTFNFPPGASEAEMEELLTKWLHDEHEGFKGSVDVEIEEIDGKNQINIMIMMEDK